MAIKLDTSSAGMNLKEQEEQQQAKIFLGIKIGMCVIAGIVVISTIVSCVNFSGKTKAAKITYDKLSVEYAGLKGSDQGAIDQADSEKEFAEGDENVEIVEVKMASAQEAGDRVAELQQKLFESSNIGRNKRLLTADNDELYTLIGKTTLWFGDNIDPDKNPLSFKFITPYDADAVSYQVFWGIYTNDSDNYLLAVVRGTYHKETDTFTISGVQMTEYGKMLTNYGAIKTDRRDSQLSEDIVSMADDLGDFISEYEDGTGVHTGLDGDVPDDLDDLDDLDIDDLDESNDIGDGHNDLDDIFDPNDVEVH